MLNSSGRMEKFLPQGGYVRGVTNIAALTREVVKSMTPESKARIEKFKRFDKNAKPESYIAESMLREVTANELIKAQLSEMIKAGVTTSTGYNFYDLRGPAYLIYPVNTPFRNSIPRKGKVNAGAGTAAHWQATRNFGIQYAGVLEGQRNALATPDDNTYVATYKEIGVERGVSFSAEFAGEGYTDNVADEHIRGMHELWLGEEGLDLGGNSGTAAGNNGFALGTANTPVAALAGTGAAVLGPGSAPGTLFPNATNVSARVVELTMLGNPNNAQYGYGVFPTVVAGLTPSYTRTNYDGTTTTINGGLGAISASSGVVSSTTANGNVTFTVTPKTGAVAWAWFIDITDASSPSAANAILSFITTVPKLTTGSSGGGTQAGNAAGLSADHSFNTSDYDGLLAYAANAGLWTNQLGAQLTSVANGRVAQLETDLAYFWNLGQATVNTIWCSADAKLSISDAILANSGSIPTAYHFNVTRDEQGHVLGGFVVDAYKTLYSMDPSGAGAIPLRIHPMLPPGTIYYDISENPYPQSRVPGVREKLLLRDYYSIEWPLVTRQWTFGTYAHQVLAHYMPWLSGVRTGIGAT